MPIQWTLSRPPPLRCLQLSGQRHQALQHNLWWTKLSTVHQCTKRKMLKLRAKRKTMTKLRNAQATKDRKDQKSLSGPICLWFPQLHFGDRNLSLTVITLTVGDIDKAVFRYQKQVMFNTTVFDGGPRCHIDTCFWYPNKTVFFEIPKASYFAI